MKLNKSDKLTIRFGVDTLQVTPAEDVTADKRSRIKVLAEGEVMVIHMKNVLSVNGVNL